MFKFSVALFAAITLTLATTAQSIPEVFINELNCDNPGGPDGNEFIELYGEPGVSLDSIVLVLFEGSTDVSYAAYDLDGYVLGSEGFFVIGTGTVTGVDLIIPSSTISNGQDGLALYHADGIDFPTGTIPTTDGLIDAMVYGTADPTDVGLISLLGLDLFVDGYLQLDETNQMSGADISISRVPDGGIPFVHTQFIVQEITPDTWNQPLCNGGQLTTTTSETNLIFCDTVSALQVELLQVNGIGDSLRYVVTYPSGEIISTQALPIVDFTDADIGTYFIHGVWYNGHLIGQTITSGAMLNEIASDACVALSQNYVSVEINSCGGCDGGLISCTEGSNIAICMDAAQPLIFTNTSSSNDDSYLFIISDEMGLIVDTFSTEINTTALNTGAYLISGLSYLGSITNNALSSGMPLSEISSEGCVTFSENTITLNIYDCLPVTPCTHPFISEYFEGNNGSRAIEIFNPSLEEVALDDYSLLRYNDGATSPTATLGLSGLIAPLGTMLVVNPGTVLGSGQTDPALIELADLLDEVANFTGNDAIELRHNNTLIDVIGIAGTDPGNQQGWSVGDTSTRNVDLVRKFNIQQPSDVWEVNSTQWDSYPIDDFTRLGSHAFQTCTDQLVAGFTTSQLNLGEDSGTISISVQCLNAVNSVELEVAYSGGTANGTDYSANFPLFLNFDSNNTTQSFDLEVLDDMLPEAGETIVLTLLYGGEVFWINQTLILTIIASDPNCDGGIVSSSLNDISQCSDESNAPIDVEVTSPFPEGNYGFVITDTSGIIFGIFETSPISMDEFPSGIYHIYGLAFTGALDTTTTVEGLNLENISADTCLSISANFILVVREPCYVTGCTGGEIAINDGATSITHCTDGLQGEYLLVSNGGSSDDVYTYLFTDNNGDIIGEVGPIWNTMITEAGLYQIWGLSYTGTLDAQTMSTGDNILNIAGDGCIELSSNHVAVLADTCYEEEHCSTLFFSEMIENIQSDKALEIYNSSPFPILLDEFIVNQYADGALIPTFTLQCTGTLFPYDVFVIGSSGNGQDPIDPLIADQADTLHAVANFSGNDFIELVHLGLRIDAIGAVGENPGLFGWAAGSGSTSNQTLVRRPEIVGPTGDWTVGSGQWIAYEPNDYSHLGMHSAQNCGLGGFAVAGFNSSEIHVNEDGVMMSVEITTYNVNEVFSLTVDANGSATQGEDFSATFPITLEVPASGGLITFPITFVNDNIDEGVETLVLTLTSEIEMLFSIPEMTLYIHDPMDVGEKTETSVQCYPNPAKEYLEVKSESPIMSISIHDAGGRQILAKSIAGHLVCRIPLEGIAPGMYQLGVQTTQGIFRKMVLITTD